MNHNERCDRGRIARYCEEKRLEIEINKDFKVIRFKQYCRAKDLKRNI